MSWRGRKRRFVAALALAAALVVPAAPVQAAESGSPGELAGVWEQVWQWVAEVLDPVVGLLSDCEHGSYIDPNG
jgi:type IV secretory pathway VirB2 component (pilin)